MGMGMGKGMGMGLGMGMGMCMGVWTFGRFGLGIYKGLYMWWLRYID